MSESINRFIPIGDIRESREIIIDAPASLVFDVAEHFEIESVPVARFMVWFRAKFLRAPHTPLRGRLVDLMRSRGWGTLAAVERRELVMGAVAQPWAGEVKFRSIPPEHFVEFCEPDVVKIVCTIEAEEMTADITRFRTQTRALATDSAARTKFVEYWKRFSPGIKLIRRSLVRGIKREAERRFKLRAGISTPAPLTH